MSTRIETGNWAGVGQTSWFLPPRGPLAKAEASMAGAGPNFLRQAVVSLLLAIVWFLTLAPTTMGGPASFIMVSGTSMEPMLHTGDFVITHTKQTYAVGDLIVYTVPEGEPGEGARVIHRIIGGDAATGFITQGDNKPEPDLWRPTQADIIGEHWVTVPKLGVYLANLRSPAAMALFAAGLTFIMVLIPERKKRTDS